MNAKIFVLDCRDSFVYTVIDHLRALGAEVAVERDDRRPPRRLDPAEFDGVLLSPGPGRPADAPAAFRLLASSLGSIPVLGICLGMQVLAEHCGARVAPTRPRHGETSRIRHRGRGVFAGLPADFTAARYHSLAVRGAGLPAQLEVTARTRGGTVMGLRHRRLAAEGIQFHPESAASEHGFALLSNWLRQLGASASDRVQESATIATAAATAKHHATRTLSAG